MKFIHRISEISSLELKLGDPDCRGFCLGDFEGGYLWLDQKPASRYQGWFVNLGQGLVKILENIEVAGSSPISAITNNFWNVRRLRGPVCEDFFVPAKKKSLVYKISQASDITLTLDIKASFDNDEFGRAYEISRVENCVVVKFRKNNAPDDCELFLAIICDSPLVNILQDWIARDYSLDRSRGSTPYSRWVLRAVEFAGATRIVISAASDYGRAVKEANFVNDNLANLRSTQRREAREMAAAFAKNFGLGRAGGLRSNPEIAMGGLCSVNALKCLMAPKGKTRGLFAGLPWFFQFWPRDAALSLEGLSQAYSAAALEVFFGLLDDLESGFERLAPDAVGWFFFAADKFAARHLFSIQEKKRISLAAEKIISYILKNQTIDGLAINNPGFTWMDSIDRPGARIEIQALRLNLYRLAASISASATKREFYRNLEMDLLLKTRKNFWAGSALVDGCDPLAKILDTTARPNIFLAAYAYPQLLARNQWEKCFDGILPKLWLDWGGLSTVDIGDRRFHPIYSGENPASYHNGDSWFYINNIAALVMQRLSPLKYHPYVKKIFAAGTRNVLWGQVPGFASELSSARAFDPGGCFNQAWSSATFLELFQAIGSRHREGANFGP